MVVMEEIITEEGRGGGDGGDHYRGRDEVVVMEEIITEEGRVECFDVLYKRYLQYACLGSGTRLLKIQ